MNDIDIMVKKVILNFVGSLDEYVLVEESLVYTRGVEDFENYNFRYIMCYPDETFSTPSNLDNTTLLNCEKFKIDSLSAIIKEIDPDLMLMQAFGFKTCTLYRQRFEMLASPCKFLGPTTHFHLICSDKARTRLLLESLGLPVAPGFTITKNDKVNLCDMISFDFPVMVKVPTLEDSRGVSLCVDRIQLDQAVENALQLDNNVVIEKFIKGRELRGAVIEDQNGDLHLLGVFEYGVDPSNIRDQKWTKGPDGSLVINNYVGSKWFLNPNKEKYVIDTIKDVMFRAFRAMKLQDWAMFDFRMKENGEVFILEINLFHSFSKIGQFSTMANHVGISNQKFLDMMVEKALNRPEINMPMAS